jgi:hypothetical protein
MTDQPNSHVADKLIESTDPKASKEYIENYLKQKQAELEALADDAAPADKARLQLDIAEALVGVSRNDESWELARFALDAFLTEEMWQEAVECCDVLYQSSQAASLLALGMGVWLSVTFPVAPSLTVNMLSYIIDETSPKADGAAVAAITAHYIADVRTEGKEHESMTFLTKEMLARVAEGHSDVKDQEALNLWLERLQLLDPDVFLPKLALVIGAIVPADQWWFDRDALREKIPE